MVGRIKISYSEESERKLDLFRELRKLLSDNTPVLVITEVKKDLEEVFDKYVQYFTIYMNRGLLEYKSHSELTEEDFEKVMYEL